jgi:hypothetical protein
MATVYVTIWGAIVLFAVGESGRSLTRRGATPPPWAWWAFLAGWSLAITHTLVAFHVVHAWSHEDAVRNTALQTSAMFGVPVGAGVYVNYAFFAVWLADACWWRTAPAGYVRSPAVVWGLRAFYLVIIFNAAVVFASGAGRIGGLLIVSWLVRMWTARELRTRAPSLPRRR